MKVKLGVRNYLYPMPAFLVGANVNGKPNYVALTNFGVVDNVSSVSVSLGKSHHTNAGIKENGTFSVNVPSIKMVKKTDYCGLVTGKDNDKSRLFEHFYGKLGTAPLIKECPINIECRLIRTYDLPKHDMFVGEIVETYCDEQCLTTDVIDFSKVEPILYVRDGKGYWKLGEQFAKAWEIGKELQTT
jgi:flavin reductase (DIM6/NTAB) family NADH-FMN oxidoreductase RutF